MEVLLVMVGITPLVTPAPTHLLGLPPLTSLSPSLPLQQQQGHTMQHSSTWLGQKIYQMCLSHLQVHLLLRSTANGLEFTDVC